MNEKTRMSLRIAILDLYEGAANQGMRCLREILTAFGKTHHLKLEWDEFDVRRKIEIPGLEYDIYLSSGGPGSPLDSEGTEWEEAYFNWLSSIYAYNNDLQNERKKQVFFICHSFQLVCRHFNVASVSKRKSTAFGVFPMHSLSDAENEPVFERATDPFYGVDSRDYQVIQPRHEALHQMGAAILAIEKERPHVPLERAIMAIRFNENMIGTQFHPEADAIGMSLHLQDPERKKTVIENYGHEKWQSMIDHLNDPDKIMNTYSHIIPNFLHLSLLKLQPSNVND